MLNSSVYSSNKIDWETPHFLFEDLNRVWQFTLDVCASTHNAKCKKFYTVETDGLKQKWKGSVWMNPPYGREIVHWIKKAYESSLKGCTVVCLIPVRSDTRWWHDYVMKARDIKLLSKRLSFHGSNNKAPFPSAIVIFQKNNQTIPVVTSYFI